MDALLSTSTTLDSENIVSEESVQRKRIARKRDVLSPEDMEKAMHGKRSYWPFLLAIAVFLTLTGVVTNVIVLAIGAALIIVAIVGWGLERQ